MVVISDDNNNHENNSGNVPVTYLNILFAPITKIAQPQNYSLC